MNNYNHIEALLKKHDCLDYKWIKPQDIVVSQWVRMKCMFGCGDYGKNCSCPPNVPSVSDCRQFFNEYKSGVIIHFAKSVDKPEDRHSWTSMANGHLVALEREVFLSGYQKAFIMVIDNCSLCEDCVEVRSECKNPKLARPTPEAMAVDVYSTVLNHDYPIQVLSDYSQAMNRYAFLLIE